MIRPIKSLCLKFVKFDIGFILSRLVLMLPLMFIEHQAGSIDEAAEQVRHFQSGFFFSTIAIFGAFEHYVIEKQYAVRGVQYLALRFGFLGAALCLLDSLGFAEFSVPVWLFLMVVRGFCSIRLLQVQENVGAYLVVVSAVVASSLLLLFVKQGWVIATVPALLALYLTRNFAGSQSWWCQSLKVIDEAKSGAIYFATQFISSAFFQGTLFVYMQLADSRGTLLANRFYVFAFAAILPISMAGRSVLVRARNGSKSPSAVFLSRGLAFTGVWALLLAGLLWVFVASLERQVYSESLLSSIDVFLLCILVVTHSISAFLSSFNIAGGGVRGQLLCSVAGILIAVALLFFPIDPLAHVYPMSLVVASLAATLLRLRLAISLVSQSTLEYVDNESMGVTR